jgi:RNA polymerase sigma factor (sigma-70 family)
LDDLAWRIGENEWGDEIKRQYADHPTLGPIIAKRARAHNEPPSHGPLTETQRDLVQEHLPLVRSLAGKRSYGSHVLYNELVTFGIEFLTDLVRQYDPNRGVTFGAFAKPRLMGAMRDYVKHRPKTEHGLSEDAVEAITHKSGRKGAKRSPDNADNKRWSKADAQTVDYLRAVGDYRVSAPQDDVRRKHVETMIGRFLEEGGTVKRKTPPLNEQLEKVIGRLNQRQQMVYRERVLKEPPTPIAQLARRLGIAHENEIARIQHQAERKVANALRKSVQ